MKSSMNRMCALAAFLSLAVSAPALAQTADEAVADVIACEAVRGTKARLRCFEAALPALKAASPAAVALAVERAETARQAAAEEAKEDFGLTPAQQEETRTASAEDFEREAFGEDDLETARKAEEEDEIDEIAGVAVEIGKNNRGKLFVVLDNGQVWRQIDGDSSSPWYPKDVEGLPVKIKKGMLGSYFVKIGKARDAFKANRIK